MIRYVRLNLLPYRDMYRQQKRRKFYVAIAIMFVIVGSLTVALYSIIGIMITSQQSRNDKLQKNIVVIEKDLKRAKELLREKQILLQSIENVHGLQQLKFLPARIMSRLGRMVPNGVQLISIEYIPKHDRQYWIHGNAVNDDKLSEFIDNIVADGLFGSSPTVHEIRTHNKLQEFKIRVILSRRLLHQLKQ